MSDYKATQTTISGGSTMSSNIAGAIGAAASMAVPQGGNSSSDTQAGIAQGTINVRNNPAQDLSGLDRNPTLDNQALKNGFDLQKIETNQQLGQTAGYVGMHAAGDIEQVAGMGNGTAGAITLHTIAGGAIASLAGGNAAQGAMGAGAGEAVLPYLTQYGSTATLAGTSLIGGLVGGGAGAATAYDGTQYNYLTHRQLDDLQKKVNQCGSDQVCVQSATSDAETLSATQEKDLVGGCNGSPSALYCVENYKGTITDAINYVGDPLATQLGLQVDQDISGRDYVNNQSTWAIVKGNNAVNNDGKMMLAVPMAAIAAALGGAPAAGVLAEDGAAGATGAIWQFLVASRGGAATTSGAINLGVQLYGNGGDFSKVNYIDVGGSTATGYLSYGGNVVLNGLVGTSVGMAQTEANNLYYDQHKSLLMGGLTGGATSMAGYMIGSGVSKSMQTSVFVPVSSFIWGNIFGGLTTEGSNWGIEAYKQYGETQQGVSQ